MRSTAHYRGICENWPIASAKVLLLQYHKRFTMEVVYIIILISHYVRYIRTYVCRDDVGKMATPAVGETVSDKLLINRTSGGAQLVLVCASVFIASEVFGTSLC